MSNEQKHTPGATYAIYVTNYGYKLEIYDRLQNCAHEETFATKEDAKQYVISAGARLHGTQS